MQGLCSILHRWRTSRETCTCMIQHQSTPALHSSRDGREIEMIFEKDWKGSGKQMKLWWVKWVPNLSLLVHWIDDLEWGYSARNRRGRHGCWSCLCIWRQEIHKWLGCGDQRLLVKERKPHKIVRTRYPYEMCQAETSLANGTSGN